MISPHSLIKEYRGKAKFICNSDTAPIWTLNGQKLPSDIKLYNNDSILVINNVKAIHKGLYNCWGYSNRIQQYNIIDHATLDMQGMTNKIRDNSTIIGQIHLPFIINNLFIIN